MNYQYDGTFEGFLSVVFRVYHDGTGGMESIGTDRQGTGLFGEYCFVPADWSAARRVLNGFAARAGYRAVHILYYAFLSDIPKREGLLFQYMKEGFRGKTGSSGFLRESWMWTVAAWARKTGREKQRMLGLIRFSELENGMLYAPIRPDTFLLPLTAGHFIQRMPSREWVIHDVGRHRAVYYHEKKAEMVEVERPAAPLLGDHEETVQQWWAAYYQSIAVKERFHPSLRRSCMPEKYWEFLTEMKHMSPVEK